MKQLNKSLGGEILLQNKGGEILLLNKEDYYGFRQD